MQAAEILEKLVAFPTVSAQSNLDLIGWVESYLDGFGVKSTRVYNAEGDKAGLFALIGPEAPGGVVLSGHTDVVPVEGQSWSSDPFALTLREGRYYGRGTCDMKGFAALALAAVPLALERGIARPLQLALSYDEEVGCTGAPPLIDAMRAVLPPAEAVIVGEPSMMKAVTGHKGGYGWHIEIRGFEVHSSLMHQGVNAIMEGARLIDWVNGLNDRIRAAPPSQLAAAFEPPFTTVHTGMIQGGTAHNITAKACSFGIDFRLVPGEEIATYEAEMMARIAEIETAMKAVRPEAGISVEKRFDVPGLRPERDGAAEALVRRLTGDNAAHVVSYGTEAGHFQDRAYSTVICGPGDIAQAHQADEYLAASQLEAGSDFMERLVSELAA